MFKRIGLFLITNLLVVLTVSVIMSIVMPMLGIDPRGMYGLAVFCGIFGMGGAFISLAISRWMAKRAYRIELVDGSSQGHNERAVCDMIVRLSRQAKLPAVPEVGIYDSPEPNAFATGPSNKKSLVAFSTGLLNSMNQQEVEAVAAHEISHIANGDMVTMTLLTGVANALVMFIARLLTYAIDSFLSDDDGDGGLGFISRIIITMLLETVLMIFASIPLAAFSRMREYKADAGAAKLSSSGSMINALKTLSSGVEAHYRKDSFSMAKINSGRRVSLWSTHPSIEDRIKRLQSMR
jgi:heat shock protein HtpX